MAAPVEVAGPDTDVATIAERMLTGHLRALPVVAEGLLVGIVARRDLLRTMIRTDDVVKANLRGLLDQYAGSRRHWEVAVTTGLAAITGDFADDAEKSVVAALARTVNGVSSVVLVPNMPADIGWDD
jgi:CBS domain-containing protein